MNVAVIIPWADDGSAERRHGLGLVRDYYADNFRDWRVLRTTGVTPPIPISQLCNIGANVALRDTIDVLVFNWADCLVPPHQLADAVTIAAATDGMVKPYTHYIATPKGTRPPTWQAALATAGDDKGPAVGASALLVMNRATWNEIGGYDPRFVGWGYHDFAYEIVHDAIYHHNGLRVDGRMIHLWHPPDPSQFEELAEKNRRLCDRYEHHRGDLAGLRAIRAEVE